MSKESRRTRSGNDHPTSMPTFGLHDRGRLHERRGGRQADVACALCEVVNRARPAWENPLLQGRAQPGRRTASPLKCRDGQDPCSPRPGAEWVEILNKARSVPCGPIYTMDQGLRREPAGEAHGHLDAGEATSAWARSTCWGQGRSQGSSRTPAHAGRVPRPKRGEHSARKSLRAGVYAPREIETIQIEKESSDVRRSKKITKREGAVATVLFSNPEKMNAMTVRHVDRGAEDACRARRRSVRARDRRGRRREKAFPSSGADHFPSSRKLRGTREAPGPITTGPSKAAYIRRRSPAPKPRVVARIRGHLPIGGPGSASPRPCDIRIASDNTILPPCPRRALGPGLPARSGV